MTIMRTVQVGRMVLREDRDVVRQIDAGSGGITLKLTGQQSHPSLTTDQVRQQAADILSSQGQIIPVIFTEKPNLNGYYIISDYEVDQSTYIDDGADLVPWSMNLSLVGTDTEIDFESRLGGTPVRKNGFGIVSASRWHCPPVNAYGYAITGQVGLPVTSRVGSEGTLKVVTGLPDDTPFPRWGCAVENYALGRVRFSDAGVERTGTTFKSSADSWELHNTLVRAKPAIGGGAVELAWWHGTSGAWFAKRFDVLVGGVTANPWDSCTVLYNDYHRATIRLMKTMASVGRATLDITMRRGSRVAELYFQTSTSATLKVVRTPAEASSSVAGGEFVNATAADANGFTYMLGSSVVTTTDLANGGLSLAGAVAVDFAVGAVYTGSGETTTQLYNQYLGTPSELITGIGR